MPDHSPQVLREAARAASSFQRSAYGYTQYAEWERRLRADAQRLVNVLEELGFKPSPQRSAALQQFC